jgi:hypothetical protein
MITNKLEDEGQKQSLWEHSAALSLLILIVSNVVLLGFFVWIFSH